MFLSHLPNIHGVQRWNSSLFDARIIAQLCLPLLVSASSGCTVLGSGLQFANDWHLVLTKSFANEFLKYACQCGHEWLRKGELVHWLHGCGDTSVCDSVSSELAS